MVTSENLPPDDYEPTAWDALPSYPVVSRVSQLVRQVAAAAQATPAGSGLHSLPCVATCDPTGSWQRTQADFLALLGESSAGYSAKWPRSAIVSASTDGRLAMWERPTSASASSSSPDAWPTPTICGDYNRKGASPTSGDGLATAARAWPSPTVADATGGHLVPAGTSATGRKPDGTKATVGLNQAVRWASARPTPTVNDARNDGAPSQMERHSPGLNTVAKLWPTPSAMSPNETEDLEHWQARRARLKEQYGNGNGCGMPLGVATRLWAPPNARDFKGAPGSGLSERGGYGPSLPRGVAGTDGKGSLNPDWELTLMGYPSDWLACAGPPPKVRINTRTNRRASPKE